jgi:hypothetical protein
MAAVLEHRNSPVAIWNHHSEGVTHMSAPALAQPGSVQRRTVETMNPSQQDIADLAYELWQQRGCPDDSSEEDWTEAERQLRTGSEPAVSSGRR